MVLGTLRTTNGAGVRLLTPALIQSKEQLKKASSKIPILILKILDSGSNRATV